MLAFMIIFAMVAVSAATDHLHLMQRRAKVTEETAEATEPQPFRNCQDVDCDVFQPASDLALLQGAAVTQFKDLHVQPGLTEGSEEGVPFEEFIFAHKAHVEERLRASSQSQAHVAEERSDPLHVHAPQGEDFVRWSLCNASFHSNLGGFGPDTGEQVLRYRNVANVEDAEGHANSLDLVVETMGPYLANAPEHNGVSPGSCFGAINVASNSTGTNSVTLRFKWYLAGTTTRVTLSKTYFTIYDLDGTKKASEAVTFYNKVRSVYISDNSELTQTGEASAGLTFSADGFTNNVEMPADPNNLTDEQMNRAATLLYLNHSEFKLTFSVTGGKSGRNFAFTGHTGLAPPYGPGYAAPVPWPTPPPTPSPTPAPTPSATTSTTTPSPTASTTTPTPSTNATPTTSSPSASTTTPPTPMNTTTQAPTTSTTTPSPTASTTTPTPGTNATTTTPSPTSPMIGGSPSMCPGGGNSCSIYEDPHIEVFDGMKIALLRTEHRFLADYGAGDMWLVKSSHVSIQGRYLPDPDLPEGNLFVRAVAVGGPFLDGGTLILGPLDEEISWNGKPILKTQNSDFEADVGNGKLLVYAQRHTDSHLVQDMTQTNAGVDVELPLGVNITVNRYKKHVNIWIQMHPAEGGQEGLCGNFNCDAADDTLDMIMTHRNPQVREGESLFDQ